MKRAIFAALIMTVASLGVGCKCFDKAVCGDGCGRCGFFKRNGCGLFGHCGCRGADDDGAYAGGPPVGQVTYPYYTNRGPRDFLAESPRGIGP
jgi:hypothetical protein